MYPEYSLREANFISLVLGTHTIRGGFADPFKPVHAYPIISSATTTTLNNTDSETPREGGAQAGGGGGGGGGGLQKSDSLLKLESALQFEDLKVGGRDWEGIVGTLHKILLKDLGIKRSRSHGPVCIAVPLDWSRLDYEKLTQIMFEKFNVPGIHLAPMPLATLYGFGAITGLVIDIGHTTTSNIPPVAPIIDTAIISPGIRILPIGAKHMKESLRSLLSTEDYFRKPDSLPITDELVDYIFTQSGVVEMAQTTELSHILAARGGAARALKVAKVDRMDVTYQDIKFSLEAMFDAVSACEFEKRGQVMENLALTGGVCNLKGLRPRLTREISPYLVLSAFAHDSQPRKSTFLEMPRFLENFNNMPQHATALGCIIMAKLIFPGTSNFIAKTDYNELGPSVINQRGY